MIAAIALLTLGLATGTTALLALTALPLVAFILGVLQGVPRPLGITIEAPTSARAGDTVRFRAEITLTGPPGLVFVQVHVPPEFDLVTGTNVHVIDKPRGHHVEQLGFTVRAAKRGQFLVGTADVAAASPTGLRVARSEALGTPRDLEVHPRIVPVRRLRSLRGTAVTIAPDEDVARVGIQTNDFRELREYRWGDPPRAVNWKATARLAGVRTHPLVNEYEVEGRKAVWFFLDAGRHMAVGTSVENGFEVAIAAVSGLALAYLDRGYRVGLYAYNTPGSEPLYPDVGTKQFLKVQRLLARLEPGPGDEGPLQAMMRARRWLVTSSPLVVFVTRTEVATDHLEEAVRRVQAMTPGRKSPVLIIEPQAFHLVPGDVATSSTARLLSELARPRHQRLRQLGATVVPWNPEREPLERLLFRGVLA